MDNKVNIIGAGLAGCEVAYQLIKRNIPVNLYEMRGHKQTEAHKTDLFGELVCSNSLRSAQIENAVGLLKEEMRILDSLIMRAADYARIPAGGALAVDRDMFSGYITDYLKQHPLINFINKEVEHIPGRLSVIATGPLTSAVFNKSIQDFFGFEHLHFYDAIAPIVAEESVNREKVYLKSRYDKGEAAYYNCPMTKYDFDVFYEELMGAERVIPRDFEVFEGCMAIEDMAFRGKETLLYGPMKPVGLTNPKTKELPYAVVQLRADDAARTMYNIVGFQTRLKYPEQLRILRLIPGLENCRIIRYGAMHRNTFINSPKLLNKYYQTKQRDTLFFAGQITGVEGYLESASSGLVAGVNVARFLTGRPFIDFGSRTVIGALANYISLPNEHFQPMNANFGIVAPLEGHYKKRERRKVIVERSLSNIRELAVEINE